MKTRFTLPLVGLGMYLPFASMAQQPTRPLTLADSLFLPGEKHKKMLPADLPQQKLLFVKYTQVPLAAKGPKGAFNAEHYAYAMKKDHNEAVPEANRQLRETVSGYPYAYRITTLDSLAYYRRQGYKYVLMQEYFTAKTGGTYQGATAHGTGNNRTVTSTHIDLYVQDLTSKARYVFDDFHPARTYFYREQVEMLLKKVSKQFGAKKS